MGFDFKQIAGIAGAVTTAGAVVALIARSTGHETLATSVEACTSDNFSPEKFAVCRDAAHLAAEAARSEWNKALVLLAGLGNVFSLFGSHKKTIKP